MDCPPDTPISEVDAILKRLASKAQAWADTSTAERARYLRQCVQCALRVWPDRGAKLSQKFKFNEQTLIIKCCTAAAFA